MSFIKTEILQQVLLLVRSPLLQGAALDATLEFFQALVASSTAQLAFPDLLRVCVFEVFVNIARKLGIYCLCDAKICSVK